jgi:tetratricopeptide (TPR) repeat protein
VTARPGSLDLPHRAYIEALADATEGSAAWHSIIAGYAVLQLFESWMDGGFGATAPSQFDIHRVRRYVEQVPKEDGNWRCLSHIVECIEARTAGLDVKPGPNARLDVVDMLAAYGKLLQFDARWALAADVHDMVIECTQRMNDVPRMLEAMLMRGYSLRMLGRLDEASHAYAALRTAATAANDVRYQLESQLSDAKVAIDRGNFPLARDLLDRTIAEARRTECSVIVSKGLNDRARLAAMERDHEGALVHLYEALELEPHHVLRERILSNIAYTFAQMGLRNASRDAELLITATTQDTITKQTALVNLMELAYQDDRELVFEQYRRDLAREGLTPFLELTFLETCVAGLRAFGRRAEAQRAAERMLDVAERHGFNEFVLKADALLRDADAAPPQPVAGEPSATPQAITIARAIADLRIAAGVRD